MRIYIYTGEKGAEELVTFGWGLSLEEALLNALSRKEATGWEGIRPKHRTRASVHLAALPLLGYSVLINAQ